MAARGFVPFRVAADRLGITRPRLNDLLRGKLGKFSLDALVNLVSAAGLRLEIRVADAALRQKQGPAGAEPAYAPSLSASRNAASSTSSPCRS